MIDLITFDHWNEVKKKLHQKEKEVEFFKERQIWWCSIGQNLGSESYGKGATFSRPVLIFKKLSQRTFLGIPLTSKTKPGSWYVTIRHRSREITALLNQIRIYDKKRLANRFGEIDDEDFRRIKAGFSAFYCS
ncbi:hypothetical protein A3B87_00770 [Candidatus Kuenenbacteria bacterium RIFCSPHIGHO2_02_FULL_39_13]|uniref:Toxin-antitoxin system protein n=1 Tax=Candidatus Kuenenbacteria bacterium RIFCSPHIGHO2_02_FULL_39_13 TaxID=1798561 RepID=A0A1F6FNG4_9BACT|nr:MAG: hypothetical protein A3B87_00770 [Candidatus Kuenenbacteria bacterium RIFCSPHIGHO2_02_FULL_39_13]